MTDANPHPVVGPDLSWSQPSAPTDPLYAPWWRRAAGAAVDVLVALAVYLLGVAISLLTDPDPAPAGPTVGGIVAIVGAVLVPVVWFWNRGREQGRSGRSLGRSLTGTRLVSEASGEPIGTGPALDRDIAHLLDVPLLVGYLRPLWHPRRQTFADRSARTIVVRDVRDPDA